MNLTSKAIIAGFAIFSMLFGSGNIVFPIIVGQEFSSNFLPAIFGWVFAAVIIPVGGYYGSMLFDADNKKYLAPLGKHLTFLLILIVMILSGPFGIIPRNINVSFGGVALLAPNTSEIIFNFISCVVMVAIAWNPGKLVGIMGTIFTPLKLGGISIIAIAAFVAGADLSAIPTNSLSSLAVFSKSMQYGYQTLDLLASFTIAIIVFTFVKNAMPKKDQQNKKLMMKFSAIACITSAIVLTVVYVLLILIGAQYSAHLTGVPNESLFTKIAEISLGQYASWFISIVIVACCLATNITLTSIFTDYIHKDITKEKYNRNIILIIIGAITFAISLVGFGSLVEIMANILSKIYPVLIVFTVLRIGYYFVKIHNK